MMTMIAIETRVPDFIVDEKSFTEILACYVKLRKVINFFVNGIFDTGTNENVLLAS